MDKGVWWATVHGVIESWLRLTLSLFFSLFLCVITPFLQASQAVLVVKNLPSNAGDTRELLGLIDPWVRKIPWSRKWQPAQVFLPGRLQSMEPQRVGYD